MPNGKLAMWLFLVTEIMFFTGLIGVYLLMRNGTPTRMEPWPAPIAVPSSSPFANSSWRAALIKLP